MIPDSIVIFTDGSSRGNPGPGGFAAIIITNNRVEEIGGREEHTTNNRMELTAAIKSLSSLSQVNGQWSIVIYCDSSYVIKGITKWVFGWQKNGWQTATKKEVENRDLWESLVKLTTIYRSIEWKQVGGHVGVRGNERCDEIATAFADGTAPQLYSGDLSNYAIKNILNIGENSSARADKNKSSAHSKAKAYSYVSLVDGKVLTHKTWVECESRVKGKKARFKKALSQVDESSIIKEFLA
ncbi:MAG: ribonuclease HI [Patescibacteria group bacterium]